MTHTADICVTAVKFFYDFQTLISGMLAIGAAAIGAYALWRSAQLPFVDNARRERETLTKKRLFLASLLYSEFQIMATRARQAEGTINAVIASNTNVTDDTREKTVLKFPEVAADWDLMSSVPPELLRRLFDFRKTVEDHNSDMKRAGGAFGANNFRQSILGRISQIAQQASQLSGQFSTLN